MTTELTLTAVTYQVTINEDERTGTPYYRVAKVKTFGYDAWPLKRIEGALNEEEYTRVWGFDSYDSARRIARYLNAASGVIDWDRVRQLCEQARDAEDRVADKVSA